ncbi:MAG: SMP-30/gluconolactonase/LRE family protein [Alphaproteobacteria bacterium]|nr:SMP-30/gluconolactonase/LRE family protein [Alphaproteobacteria bacterium]MBL7097439.1 SMP-30/gluconolactonase/LRE family protein [Alphaproteobacteria bacterium]
MKAEPFVTGLSFGEGLHWHQGRFWYSDFYRHRISTVGPGGDVRVEVEIEDQPSGLGWLPDGRLLFVAMTGQKVMRREADGRIVQHADLSGLATFHCNDMVVDAHGNAFVGCFGFNLDQFIAEKGPAALWTGEGPPRAPLMWVKPDGRASVVAADMRFPNGTVIIDGGKTLVAAETFGPSLTAFDLAPDGRLSNRRVWASLRTDPPSIAPDGTCADSENCIWVANPLAPECIRVAEGGKIVERVQTAMNAYACALGGSDGRSLLIATSQNVGGNITGQLEIVRVGVPA